MKSPISQAIVVNGPLLFISGQIALHPDGTVAHPGNAGAQAAQVFDQIVQILAENKATVENLVKLTTYMTDISDINAIRQVRMQVLGGHIPTATTIAVAALAKPGLCVEIEAIAALPQH